MKKKKMNLNRLKVRSFIVDEGEMDMNTIKGGIGETGPGTGRTKICSRRCHHNG